MHLEFLLEELSAEAFLEGLLPRILPAGVTWRFIVFQGKRDLLAKLPGRLKAYRRWLPAGWRIVVLVDEDRQDCRALKRRMEQVATDAGLVIKAFGRPGIPFELVNRIAVEELEAWFLGNVPALAGEFPGVTPTLANQAKYRDPDMIQGGTWETLERVLQGAGYYPAGLSKIDVARRLGRVLPVAENRSGSFGVFLEALGASVA